jgi:hypothetical protein
MIVAVDPTNTSRAIFGGVTILATTNSGASFVDVGNVYGEASSPGGFIHPDYQSIAFTGANSFYVGNDGGVWKTTDLGGTGLASDWTNLNAGLAVTQFYTGSALSATAILGGAQDNGSLGNLAGAAALPAMQTYHGGDGGYTWIDSTPGSSTIYAEYPQLGIEKGSSTLKSGDQYSPYDSFVTTAPCSTGSEAACNDPGVAFIAPFRVDPTNHNRLIAATNHVYQSTSDGTAGTWSAISPDLSDPAQPATYPDFISAMVMGQQTGQTGTILAGTDQGEVWITTNGGTTWSDITANLPAYNSANYVFPNHWINGLAFNPSNTKEAWVAIGALNVGHIWHTNDDTRGASTVWTSLDGSGGTAIGNQVVSSVVPNPLIPGTIYVGTYYGVYGCSACGGCTTTPSWTRLGSGLPNAFVNDVTISADQTTLIAWTHGRGAWTVPLPTPVQTPPLANKVFLPFIPNTASCS